MNADRYAPTVLYQDAALRIVQTWQVDCRCYERTDAYRDHLFTAEACPDPTARRSLVIERTSESDALGQPIWLPGGALQAAELLRLLEGLTLPQLQALQGSALSFDELNRLNVALPIEQPAEQPRPDAPIRCPECSLPVDPRKSAVTDEVLQPDGRWQKRLLHAQCWSSMQRAKDAASTALPLEATP